MLVGGGFAKIELTDKVGEFMKDVRIERDWRLLKKRLPQWQEYYIQTRLTVYRQLLSDDATLPSERFWKLNQLLKEDKQKTGIQVEASHSKLDQILLNLLYEGAITKEDLTGFSDELVAQVLAFFKSS